MERCLEWALRKGEVLGSDGGDGPGETTGKGYDGSVGGVREIK